MDILARKIKAGRLLKFKEKESRIVSDPTQRLAAEIVIHAIMDWREMVRRKVWNPVERYCNYDEIRVFFKSEWCAYIMQNFDIAPEYILAMLEKELQEAMERDEQATRQKMKGLKK